MKFFAFSLQLVEISKDRLIKILFFLSIALLLLVTFVVLALEIEDFLELELFAFF